MKDQKALFKIATESSDMLRLSIAEEISKLDKSERINELLACSFGRVLVNEFKRGDLNADHYGAYIVLRLEHIADWIEAAVANDEPWLSNVDEQGRPKKLLKFSNGMQIVREANRDMMRFAQKNKDVALSHGDEELVKQFDNGYYLVRLLTPRALDRESGQMQHCIGQGAYDQKLEDGEYEYLSLRDPTGKPHVTIEMAVDSQTCARDLKQFQGKQNQPPISKYNDILVPFLREAKVTISEASPSLPYITDDHGIWHNVYDLPDELEIKSLKFIDYEIYENGAPPDDENPITLPKRLIGTQTLDIGGACLSGVIESHPENMNITLAHVQFMDEQKVLRTNGQVYLFATSFSKPPEQIEGSRITIKAAESDGWPLEMKSNGTVEASGDLPDFAVSIDCLNFKLRPGLRPNDVVHDIKVHGILDVTMNHNYPVPRGVKTKDIRINSHNGKCLNILFPDFPEVSGIIDVQDYEGYEFPDHLPDSTRINFEGEVTLGEYRYNQRLIGRRPLFG